MLQWDTPKGSRSRPYIGAYVLCGGLLGQSLLEEAKQVRRSAQKIPAVLNWCLDRSLVSSIPIDTPPSHVSLA